VLARSGPSHSEDRHQAPALPTPDLTTTTLHPPTPPFVVVSDLTLRSGWVGGSYGKGLFAGLFCFTPARDEPAIASEALPRAAARAGGRISPRGIRGILNRNTTASSPMPGRIPFSRSLDSRRIAARLIWGVKEAYSAPDVFVGDQASSQLTERCYRPKRDNSCRSFGSCRPLPAGPATAKDQPGRSQGALDARRSRTIRRLWRASAVPIP